MRAISAIIKTSVQEIQHRQVIAGNQPSVLADIYQDVTNIVIWQRKLGDVLTQAADHILETKPALQFSVAVTPQSAYAIVNNALGATQAAAALSEDVTQLVDMFCCLFDLKHAGLRLTAEDRAMCPRFHFDRVPCRLVTTYRGIGTQWLAHHLVDRSKLGAGNQGKPDEHSGLFEKETDIQQLSQGDVALLKGALWHGNEDAGLVHRSPRLPYGTHRLLLTLDFIND